jgi:CRISPR-associated protein Cmr2
MSDKHPHTGKALLKLQIGPVQEFIAQARSTRDLWSGSYLLSWLMAAGLNRLDQPEVNVIFPAWKEQPLRALRKRETAADDKCAIPNLPNVFLASVLSTEAHRLATETAQAIRDEWKNIADNVWDFCQKEGTVLQDRDRFDAQVGHFLAISWQITPWQPEFSGNWGAWTQANARQLAAVRQTHGFKAWNSGGWRAGISNNKDSLNGRDEGLAKGQQLRKNLHELLKPFFKHDNDWIGAITLIKRVWHVAYLERVWKFKPDHFKMPNTPGIAGHDPRVKKNPQLHDEDQAPAVEDLSEPKTGVYFAVLAFDGDGMGDYLRSLDSDEKHTDFSKKLSTFALTNVSKVIKDHDGREIYAGGDDVVALLPADTALHCAEDLRGEFKKATAGLDASAGIAIAHFANPLQDVVRAAQVAEQRAKHKLGRSAVAVTLIKRSGETVEWGCNWDGGGLGLFNAITDGLVQEALSRGFPYALVELLQPYLTASTPLMEARAGIKKVKSGVGREGSETCQQDGESGWKPGPPLGSGFDVAEVIRREFAYVLGRQQGPKFPRDKAAQTSRGGQLTTALDKYLDTLKSLTTEEQLQQVIGLLRTVAFAPAQRQSTDGKADSTEDLRSLA